MNIAEILQCVLEDDLDDEEVCFYMAEKKKKDICLCKKYGKSSKRKSCFLCNDNKNIIEPKKKQQRKYSRRPAGNFGRTGCLKKPDLCSIPEHEILSEFNFGHIPTPSVTTKTKKLNKISKSEKILNTTEPKRDCVINNHLENNKAETNTKLHENNKVMLISNATEERININGTVEGRIEYNTSAVYHMNCLTPDSEKSSNNEGNVQEYSYLKEIQRSGDGKRCYCGEGEDIFRWKKPKLIPAPDFLKRYYPLPPINSKVRNNEPTYALGNSSQTKQVDANTRREGKRLLVPSDANDGDFKDNINDDQKLINALSRITIKPLDIDKSYFK